MAGRPTNSNRTCGGTACTTGRIFTLQNRFLLRRIVIENTPAAKEERRTPEIHISSGAPLRAHAEIGIESAPCGNHHTCAQLVFHFSIWKLAVSDEATLRTVAYVPPSAFIGATRSAVLCRSPKIAGGRKTGKIPYFFPLPSYFFLILVATVRPAHNRAVCQRSTSHPFRRNERIIAKPPRPNQAHIPLPKAARRGDYAGCGLRFEEVFLWLRQGCLYPRKLLPHLRQHFPHCFP